MRAVVYHGPEDLRVETVDDPTILEPTDAIVEVRATAICGADLFPYHGLTPGFEPGTVLGHEFVGEVVDAGGAVGRVKMGQRVVCTSMTSDGTCQHCRAGRRTQCEGRALFGYSGVYPRLDGGQAELVRVPHADRCLWPVPAAVTDEAAVFVGDILPTGLGAVARADTQIGDTVVVLGCGPVGLMALLCAEGVAGKLFAVDGIAERRALAAELGAEPLAPDDALAAVLDATGGLGADRVIEAAGVVPALDAAFGLARGRGTVSVVGAHFEPDYPLNNAVMFEKELTLRFTIGDPGADRERLLGLIEGRSLDPTPVISHRLPLEQAAAGYETFDRREATKVMLHP